MINERSHCRVRIYKELNLNIDGEEVNVFGMEFDAFDDTKNVKYIISISTDKGLLLKEIDKHYAQEMYVFSVIKSRKKYRQDGQEGL